MLEMTVSDKAGLNSNSEKNVSSLTSELQPDTEVQGSNLGSGGDLWSADASRDDDLELSVDEILLGILGRHGWLKGEEQVDQDGGADVTIVQVNNCWLKYSP